ncbi:MAG: RNA methyltransferase [Bacteroidales bacterium]|jgi:tRNA G18 (ribose-2'-O)-methylase SpoU|nr:RNA methyltransferase [Bacteroidales bacterium]NLM92526.1 RNA methyltransferase [Bacteroidales bacterium]
MRKLSMDELARKTAEEFRQSAKFPLVLVLDNVRSMMNTGSLFRTADAFLLQGIVLCGITATPPHREIQKTALGATETVYWKYYEETTEAILDLKKQGFKIFALEQASGSMNLKDFRPEAREHYALVFGNEVKGVDEQVLALCDGCLEIPQFGTKHSLNVSVTAGMVVWDFFSKMS